MNVKNILFNSAKLQSIELSINEPGWMYSSEFTLDLIYSFVIQISNPLTKHIIISFLRRIGSLIRIICWIYL